MIGSGFCIISRGLSHSRSGNLYSPGLNVRRYLAQAGILLISCLPGYCAWGGQAVARLNGVVLDQAGAEVPGSSVTLFSLAKVRETTTDESGKFEFGALPAGTYELRVERPGFQTWTMESLRVDESMTRTVSITLQIRPTGGCDQMLPTISYEERPDKVNLVGTVSDYGDGPLDKAVVTITLDRSGRDHWTETGRNGEFNFSGLEPGKYTLKVVRKGYVERAGISFWVTESNLTKIAHVYISRKSEHWVIVCE